MTKDFLMIVVVVVLGFYVPPTAKVIQRRDLGLKSHLKDFSYDGTHTDQRQIISGRQLALTSLPYLHAHMVY